MSLQPLYAIPITLSSSSVAVSPAFTASFPSLSFPQSCCLAHPQSTSHQIEWSTEYFLFTESPKRRKSPELCNKLPSLSPPNCAMHFKLDQRETFQRAQDGGEESKETITAEGGEAEVDYEDKGCVTVVKTPRCPSFEILHPTICSSSNEFVIYLLLATQGLWSSASRVWCRNSPRQWMREGMCACVYFNFVFVSIISEHCEGQ